MNVDVEPRQVQEVEADSRGRIVLGSEFSNKEVEVFILSDHDTQDDKSVYLIQASNGWFKIGVSNDPERRVKEIETSCPYSLSLVAQSDEGSSRNIESKLHKEYAEERVNGEWFNLTEEQAREVAEELRR